MKILNRLREMRADRHVNPFNHFNASIDHYNIDQIGIGAAVCDDVIRLGFDKNHQDNQQLSIKVA